MGKPIKWRVKLQHLAACNCNWGCPCTFDAPPTYGTCEAAVASRIVEGKYGTVSLAGLKWAMACAWPGAIHEGRGRAVVYLDERAKGAKREALEAIALGKVGGPWGIFMSTCTAGVDVRTGKIDFDYAGKKSAFRVASDLQVEYAPITNPVSGAEHQVTGLLPTGLLCHREDFFSSKTMDVRAGPLNFSYPGRHTLAFTAVWKGP